jgi:predicted thioredoxin/glutaredoxin
MDIKILGHDCVGCDRLYQHTVKALERVRVEADIERITDPEDIWSYGIVQPPVVVIDGRIVSEGKVLSTTELTKIFSRLSEKMIARNSETNSRISRASLSHVS